MGGLLIVGIYVLGIALAEWLTDTEETKARGWKWRNTYRRWRGSND